MCWVLCSGVLNVCVFEVGARNEKVGISTEITKGVSLPGNRGRFVMATTNALTDSLDAWRPCQIDVYRDLCVQQLLYQTIAVQQYTHRKKSGGRTYHQPTNNRRTHHVYTVYSYNNSTAVQQKKRKEKNRDRGIWTHALLVQCCPESNALVRVHRISLFCFAFFSIFFSELVILHLVLKRRSRSVSTLFRFWLKFWKFIFLRFFYFWF